MRRLTLVYKGRCDALILDSSGKSFVDRCLPEEYVTHTVETRGTLPLIMGLSFLLNLVRYMIKYGPRSESLFSALIASKKPKVVVTFTDDWPVMGKLQTIFPEIMIVSIQNGIRTDDEPCFKVGGDFYSFPHYYGFGKYEESLMREKNVTVKEYQAVGSLKMGLFLSDFFQKNQLISDICFISSYKSKMEDSTEYTDRVFMDVTKILCDLISRYAQDNSLKISVAMRNGVNDKDYQRELLFYKRHILNNSLVLHPNIHDELSSYQVCMDSQVVISLDSTLSFELFGIGRKVLFCANSSDKFNDIRNVARQLKRVPSEFLLKNLNYVDFSEKIGNLLVVSDKHMAQFESSRKYYMNFLDSYPHQIIKKTIRNKTSKVHHGKDLKV